MDRVEHTQAGLVGRPTVQNPVDLGQRGVGVSSQAAGHLQDSPLPPVGHLNIAGSQAWPGGQGKQDVSLEVRRDGFV